MKRSLLVFLVITLVFSVQAHLTKRDDNEEKKGREGEVEGGLKGLMLKSKNMSMKVPLIGELTGDTIGKLIDGYEAIQLLTDGAVGRLLGGAFPCTISLDSFACTGHTVGRDLAFVIQSLLDPIPSLFFPGFVKSLVVAMIEMFVEPTIDIIFGGISKPEAAQR